MQPDDGSQPAKMQMTGNERSENSMKKWILTASIDAINIDFETIIESETEPDFWTCEAIAQEHDCNFWTVCEDNFIEK